MTDDAGLTSRRRFLAAATATAAAYGMAGQGIASARKGRGAYREKFRVDVHAHSLVPVYQEALAAAGITSFHRIPIPAWSADLALEFMGQHDIALQFLSVSDPGVSFVEDDGDANQLARKVNDQVAEVVREHPRRFGAFGVVNLRDLPGAVAEARYCLDTLKMDGIGLLSSAEGRFVGDPANAPLLDLLNSRRAWVMVHPTQPLDDDKPVYSMPDFVAEYPFDTSRAIISLMFNGAFSKWPHIRWHFAHGGGCIPMLRSRLTTMAANAKPFGALLGLPPGSSSLTESSPRRILRRMNYDTALIADPPELKAVSSMSGPKQMFFGSDWPFAARTFDPSVADPAPALSEVFSRKHRHMIERFNARRVLPRARRSVPSPGK